MIKYYNKVKIYFINRPILKFSLHLTALVATCILSFSHWPITLTEYPRIIVIISLCLLCILFSDCNPKKQ